MSLHDIPQNEHHVRWHTPLPKEYFVVTEAYMVVDWELYPEFGHHVGVDYGTHGIKDVPAYAISRGRIVCADSAESDWGKVLGNHLTLYIEEVNSSFLYCHLSNSYQGNKEVERGGMLGTLGNTGRVKDGAIHLHLEAHHGVFEIENRHFTSLEDIKAKTFDPDAFIRVHMGNIDEHK